MQPEDEEITRPPQAAPSASGQTAPETPGVSAGVAAPGRRPPAPRIDAGTTHILNFNEAPLEEVVRVFADLLKINVVIDPQVKGSVTLHSGGEVRSEDLMGLFETILSLNGAALIGDQGVYRVVPFADAKAAPGVPQVEVPTRESLVREGFALEIFYLNHMPALDVAKTIKPFVSQGAEVVSVTPANVLIVADAGPNLVKVRRLISLLDRPLARRVRIKIYPVANVDVNTLAKDLGAIFTAMGIPDKPAAGVWAEMVPLPDLGSLAVISTYPETFRTVEQWLVDLDRQIGEAGMGVFVYYCQNGDAQNIADVLTGLFGTGTASGGGTQRRTTRDTTPRPTARTSPGLGSVPDRSNAANPPVTGRTTRDQRMAARQSAAQASSQSAGVGPAQDLEQGIRFVVDQSNNAIVIRAPRKELHEFLRTIRKLDTYPKQVLIEVVIAEVDLTEGLNLGVEWSTFGNPQEGTFVDGTLTAPESLLPSSGLIYTLTRTNQITAQLRALARTGKLNVVSSPILLASENLESHINVGEEVPVVTSFTTSEDLSTGEGRKIVDRSIQYRNTGVILSVTPRINDSGLVRLAIEQELSDVSVQDFNETGSPSFFNRTATTNVITVDGQTVVIGGLIESRIQADESGIPFLKDIPLVGYLFKSREDSTRRNELIITMTPHIIHDLADAREIIARFNEQLYSLQEVHKVPRHGPMGAPVAKPASGIRAQ